MTINELRGELQLIQDLFAENRLTLDTRPVVVERTTRGFQRLTWRPVQVNAETFRGKFASLEDYLGWINAGSYTILLYDGAILQFSYDFHYDRIAGHRLTYYPCPFELDLSELQRRPLLDIIEEEATSGYQKLLLRTPLRFDFDPGAGNEGHPASHLTLNSNDCRWATISPISPGHFLRFIFRHFYPSVWNQMEFIRLWHQEHQTRTILESEEAMLHVAWRHG